MSSLAEQLPPLLLAVSCPFPSSSFVLEVSVSSASICQQRSLVLSSWKGCLGREVEKYR